MEYAEIIIDLVSDALDRPFHYRIPPRLRGVLKPGMAVRVPFGSRVYRGYVFRLLPHPAVEEVRDILDLAAPGPLLGREQLALVAWLAHRCCCRRIEALRALLPAALREGRSGGRSLWPELLPGAEEADLDRAPAQRRAVQLLAEKGPLSRTALAGLGVRAETLRALQRKGLLRFTAAPPPDIALTASEPAAPLELKEEQKRAFLALARALEGGRARKILLHGITASGKTEIYLQGIARCLAGGRGALVLVPEISLTPQMIDLFQSRFPGRVAVLHSRLTAAERAGQWQRIRLGEAAVVLGARSAVFAPVEKLGLIVLDEEHEPGYKQEEAPRYHAREVGWWRARYHKAVLLLGSATPSLESYYEGGQGRAKLLEMTARATSGTLPPVTVVDMREELRAGNRTIFSRLLLEELKGVLAREEQALLFLNRRGFASFILCRECGYVARCPSCAVSMTLHAGRGRLVCHYCAYEAAVPRSCPGCRGTRIRHFGAGTERVEEEVRRLFPEAGLVRMDSDTTAGRGMHRHLYRRFKEGKASILIGTQMIAKGFDFPRVTLVGVVAADTALNLPDFRAGERTFQLLTQVAGRTGRGPRGGKVIIQTYHPGHYSITAAARHDYAAFYREELERRRALQYPPFSDLVRFLFAGEDEASVWEAAHRFTAGLASLIAGSGAEPLGPAPAPLSRLKKLYRVHTILKGERLAALAPRIRAAARDFRACKFARPVRLAVDFNPQAVL